MLKKLLISLLGIFVFITIHAQGIAINTTNSLADTSAMLDVSGSKGVLIPRLTTANRNLIAGPATALLIYNAEVKSFQVNIGTPTLPVWKNIATMDADKTSAQNFWLTTGNIGAGANAFLGNADNKPLLIKTNSVTKIYIDSTTSKVGIGTSDPKASLHVNATDAMIVPVGTTDQRPTAPVIGMIRFNSTNSKLEGYTTNGWVVLN